MNDVNFNLTAELRSDMGKGASRRLRREGKVPAIIYGGDVEPTALTLGHNELMRHLEQESFYSHILTIQVGDRQEKAVLKDLQRHPARPIVMHADFQRVSATEKIRMHVPLHFINEDICPGKKAGGIVTHIHNEVEVICLPQDLPEFLTADLASVGLNASVHLSDIQLPVGVDIVALLHGPEHNESVVTVHSPRGGGEAVETPST